MKNVIQFLLKRPYISVILLIGIIAFGIINLKELNIDTSERSLIIQNDPDLDFYDDTVKQFVSDNIEMIYIEDDDIFTYDKLVKIENLIIELGNLDGILKTESLFNVTNFKSLDDFLNLDPFIDNIPEEKEALEQIKKDSLNNPIVSGNLISKDGKKFVIKLYLDDDRSKNEKLFDVNIVNKIEEIVNNHKGDFKDIFQIGNPYIKNSLYYTIKKDRSIIFPIAIILLFIMLMITIRSAHGALLPVLTSSVSVIAAVGFMSAINIPLNLLTFIIPSLIIVIGSTEDIHILSEYFEGLHFTKKRYNAVVYLSKKVGIAIIITALTTFLGFLSISINKILVLKQFGIAAGFGMLINPVVTFLLSPIYLNYFGPKFKEKSVRKNHSIERFFDSISLYISKFIIKYKLAVVSIFILITLFFSFFIFKIKMEYDLIQNFKDSSVVKQRLDKYQKEISGINTFFIRIKGHEYEAFLEPEYLNKIDKLKTQLSQIKEIDNVYCITDYIKLMNKGMNYDDENEYIIPDNKRLISQYFLLLDPVEMQKYITNDYNEVNIIIQHGLSSSNDLTKLINEIKTVIPMYKGSICEYHFTGFQLLTKKASSSIAIGTVQGILILSVIIFIIMSLLFMNIKAGLISLFSNSMPVLFCFGLMGFLKVPLNTGTCMVAVIALGLAIDDTIHLMSKYKIDLREFQDVSKGLTESIRSELRPVFSTSISLSCLFFSLCISDLVNIKFFGILSGLVIIYAFFCDIFLTTTLLSTTQLITILDFLSLKVKKEILGSKLLQGLKLGQVKALLLMGAIKEAKKGEYIIRENEIGNTINIILEGTVEVSVFNKKKDNRVVISELKEGDIIGEIAVLIPVKRTADIIATSNVKYFEVSDRSLERIERLRPKIAGKIYYNISCTLGERLFKLNKKYIKEVD